MVLELVDRSRKNTEKLLAQVRSEVREQIKRLGLVSEQDLAKLEKRLGLKAPAEEEGGGQEGSGQEEGGGQEGTGQEEGRGQEGDREEEGDRQEGPGQADHGQEGRCGELTATTRRRLDAELVRRGLAPSREQARAAIDAGRVTVDGAPATKPAHMVSPGQAVAVRGPGPRYVGRGGEKLAAALDALRDPGDGPAASSTPGRRPAGSPTACCRRAPPRSLAVDVGRNQLHERLRADPRVESRERTDIRAPRGPRGRGGVPVGGRRPVVHLAADRRRRPARPGGRRRRSGGAGEAAVRGGPGRGVPRPGRGDRSRPLARRAVRGDRCLRRPRSSHHGPDGVATPGGRRERRVPPARPHRGRAAPEPRTLVDAAIADAIGLRP